MKPILKAVITFIAGAAVGSGGCFVICKKYYEKREIKELEEAKKAWAWEEVSKPYKTESTSNDISEVDETYKKASAAIKKYSDTSRIASEPSNSFENDYTQYYAPDNSNGLNEALRASEEHPVDSDEDDNMADPSIIDDDELGDLSSSWEEKSATYYIKDGALIDDESDEPVDIFNTVGQKCLDDGEGQKYVFIKCPRIHTVYTVTYQDELEYDYGDE